MFWVWLWKAKAETKTTEAMKFNIISKNNGVGLSQDIVIVSDLLHSLGHKTLFVDVYGKAFPRADVNIFLELVSAKHITTAKVNILIPNPEWFFSEWIKYLPWFDVIMAKTVDCANIFKKYSDKVTYTSFTSIDRFKQAKKKKEFIHVAGKSSHKNTESVYKAWLENKDLATLHLLKHENVTGYLPSDNIKYYFKRQKEEQLNEMLNECMFHVCPSEYEGFGHYLNEARSVGGIIISTDAPPMNEMVFKSFGKLITSTQKYFHQLGQCNKVDTAGVYKAAKELQGLGDKELQQMSDASRQEYLDNDLYFRDAFTSIIKQL